MPDPVGRRIWEFGVASRTGSYCMTETSRRLFGQEQPEMTFDSFEQMALDAPRYSDFVVRLIASRRIRVTEGDIRVRLLGINNGTTRYWQSGLITAFDYRKQGEVFPQYAIVSINRAGNEPVPSIGEFGPTPLPYRILAGDGPAAGLYMLLGPGVETYIGGDGLTELIPTLEEVETAYLLGVVYGKPSLGHFDLHNAGHPRFDLVWEIPDKRPCRISSFSCFGEYANDTLTKKRQWIKQLQRFYDEGSKLHGQPIFTSN